MILLEVAQIKVTLIQLLEQATYKMKKNYRAADVSTSNFIKAISVAKHYTPYTLYKMTNDYTSFKQFQFIDLKSEEHRIPKMHKFYKNKQKNDRNDIFIEGGQVSVEKRVNNSYSKTRSQQNNTHTFYKISKNKKKSSILIQNWNQEQKQAQSFRQPNSKPIYKTQNLSQQSSKEFSYNFHNHKNIRTNTQTESKQTNSFTGSEHIGKFNQIQRKIHQKSSKYKQIHKARIIANIGRTQSQKATQIKYQQPLSSKPTFYLQSKQISHIKAQSFIVVQYPSNRIIFGNYYKKIYQIASLTKIMTFYTVYKIAEKYSRNIFQEIIQIDQKSQSMSGTSAEVVLGDLYTIQQLLYGLMLPSGNDAAMALAKWGGQIITQNKEESSAQMKIKTIDEQTQGWKIFVKQMNNYAKTLQMKSTRYGNPHGLPEQNSGSTAQDQSILVSECLKIDLFRTVVNTEKYICLVKNKDQQSDKITEHQVQWQNTNKLLRRAGFIGVKTGVTATAGPCLATCYKLPKTNKQYIVVLLRTTKLSRRFKDTRYILGLALNKLYYGEHKQAIRGILRDDVELDSDNSEDQQQFCFHKSDSNEMSKRNRILTFQS